MTKKPSEFIWLSIFSLVYSVLFFRGYVSEWFYALGLSAVLNSYPVSRALFKIGRSDVSYGYDTTEIKVSLGLFTLGLVFLLTGIVSQKSGVLMLCSSSMVYIFCQGVAKKLHADKFIRTQILLR